MHEISVMVDEWNLILEMNENNNCAIKTISVIEKIESSSSFSMSAFLLIGIAFLVSVLNTTLQNHNSEKAKQQHQDAQV